MWSETQSFTASRHLWDAASSVEFYRAWREKPQWWIENLSFKDFWMYGRPGDIDDFTRLMLTTCVHKPRPHPPSSLFSVRLFDVSSSINSKKALLY